MLFFDDQFPIHRKVARLSDAAFRLHVSAIFWCARNLTDGAVSEDDLDDVCARVRTPERFAAECVKRGLWHEAGAVCDSQDCPAHPDNAVSDAVTDGWLIHDYFGWQKSKERVIREREGNAARQKKWRDQQKQGQKPRNAVSNGARNASVTAPSPVLVPKGQDGTGSPHRQAQQTRAQDDDTNQLIVEVIRDATGQKITTGQAAAIRDQILAGRTVRPDRRMAYVARSVREDPARWLDTVAAGQASRPEWCGSCDPVSRLVGDDEPYRCPTCHPLRGEP